MKGKKNCIIIGFMEQMMFLYLIFLGVISLMGCAEDKLAEIDGAGLLELTPLYHSVSQVCNGTAVENAAGYTEESGLHPIVLLSTLGGLHEWSYGLPVEWEPNSVSEVELVACVENEEAIIIETCQYSGGPPVDRFIYEVVIYLMDAKTGETIGIQAISGDSPRECKFTERQDLTKVYGSHVELNTVTDWISLFVEI